MPGFEETFLKDKIKKYIENFDKPKIQEGILYSLENTKIEVSEFLKIADNYLNEFEIETKNVHEQAYKELEKDYNELKQNYDKLNQNYKTLVNDLEKIIKNSLPERIKELLNKTKES